MPPLLPSLGHFGDARRCRVGIDLLSRLMAVDPAGASVRALAGRRAGEVRFGRFLARDGGAAAVHCNKRPFAGKESHRRLAAAEAAATQLPAGATAVTVVGDREGDIYEDFALRPPGVEVLFRAHHDRRLATGGC